MKKTIANFEQSVGKKLTSKQVRAIKGGEDVPAQYLMGIIPAEY